MTSGMTSFFINFQYLVEAQIFRSSIFRSEISSDVICEVLIFDIYKTIRDALESIIEEIQFSKFKLTSTSM